MNILTDVYFWNVRRSNKITFVTHKYSMERPFEMNYTRSYLTWGCGHILTKIQMFRWLMRGNLNMRMKLIENYILLCSTAICYSNLLYLLFGIIVSIDERRLHNASFVCHQKEKNDRHIYRVNVKFLSVVSYLMEFLSPVYNYINKL